MRGGGEPLDVSVSISSQGLTQCCSLGMQFALGAAVIDQMFIYCKRMLEIRQCDSEFRLYSFFHARTPRSR